VPNFISFAAFIAQLAHGEKLCTQALNELIWCPGNRSEKTFEKTMRDCNNKPRRMYTHMLSDLIPKYMKCTGLQFLTASMIQIYTT